MKIKVSFFKPSGKWYTDGEAVLPDGTKLFDEGVWDLVLEKQNGVSGNKLSDYEGWFIVVSHDDDADFFFTALKHVT